jgi:cobalt/nickel transport system permease protein
MALGLDAISGAMVVFAARRVKLETSGKLIPIMGVMAAFVLAAQMLNFPVLGGTSGHLVGAALVAILLGPLAGFLTMATVILAQALFMQDGGILAIGANMFNIGAVPSFAGYVLFRGIAGAGGGATRLAFAAFVAGWGSLMLSAVFCALELALSGAVALGAGLAAMAGYHAVIGVAEGGITAGVLSFLRSVRPDLIRRPAESKLGKADWAGAIVLIAIPAVILILAGSSSLPDPLQALLETATPQASTAADSGKLLSPGRYRDYLEQTFVFAVVITIAYLASRLAHRRRRSS